MDKVDKIKAVEFLAYGTTKKQALGFYLGGELSVYVYADNWRMKNPDGSWSKWKGRGVWHFSQVKNLKLISPPTIKKIEVHFNTDKPNMSFDSVEEFQKEFAK